MSCIDCKVPQNAVRQIKFINKVSNFRRIKSMCQNVDGILKNISHFTAKSVIEENFYNFSLSSINVIFLALWGATRYKKNQWILNFKNLYDVSCIFFFRKKKTKKKDVECVNRRRRNEKGIFCVISCFTKNKTKNYS